MATDLSDIFRRLDKEPESITLDEFELVANNSPYDDEYMYRFLLILLNRHRALIKKIDEDRENARLEYLANC